MRQPNPKVAIVITTYNNRQIIDACIEGIQAQTYRNFTVAIVDDNSKDGTPEYVKKRYPLVNVMKKRRQSGPAESRNIGIKMTHSDYIAFLDSDVTLEPAWLATLVTRMGRDPKIAIAGGKLLYYPDSEIINSAGGCLTKIGIGYDRGKGEESLKYDTEEHMPFVCSAATLIRRDILEKIGSFDETYFYGYEDTDLCWRARLAGYAVLYIPDAVAYHRLSTTVSQMSDAVYFHGVKNRLRSMLKNYEPRNMALYVPLNIILTLASCVVRGGHRLAQLRGLWWNITNLTSTFKERAKVQYTRNKSDTVLFKLFTPIRIRQLLQK